MYRWQACGARQLVAALAVGAGLATPAPPARPADREPDPGDEATLTLTQERTLTILAMTDLHLVFPADPAAEAVRTDARTLAAVAAMATACRPDLLVFTGDLWATAPEDGREQWQRLAAAVAALDLPWAVAWGNHDRGDADQLDAAAEQTKRCLYRGARHHGNYLVQVRTPGRSEPVWNLVFLNSGRTGLGPAAVDWFTARAQRLPAPGGQIAPGFVFLHIPLPQFRNAGERRLAGGTRNEPVSSEATDPTAFAALTAPGWVQAVFCGHDHANDFFAQVAGIRLQYVRATGYGGYGGEVLPKGATLITADLTTRTFATRTVLPPAAAPAAKPTAPAAAPQP